MRRRGANAVELALLLPVLLALLGAVVDLAWGLVLREAAGAAARAGARAGAVAPRDGGPDTVAAEAAADRFQSLRLPVEPRIVAFRSGSPERVTVRVTVDAGPLVGFAPGPSRVAATAVERVQEQP